MGGVLQGHVRSYEITIRYKVLNTFQGMTLWEVYLKIMPAHQGIRISKGIFLDIGRFENVAFVFQLDSIPEEDI